MAFATTEDIATRLGRTLNAVEAATTSMLLDHATGLILNALGKTTLSPTPVVVWSVCVEAVTRVLLNPAGVRSESETLGAHSHSASFTAPMGALGALQLTQEEELRVRRAVFGTNTGSARPGGIIDDVLEEGLLGDRYPAGS